MPVKLNIVLAPEVVIVGDPDDVPEYLAVGTLIMTMPDPPGIVPPFAPPPPPPVFTVPA